jgi:hypothetical protein
MSIRFICTCGKHLRARDEMAARRSVCPACGKPVGIPTLLPTQRGTAVGPLTPGERQAYRPAPADDLLYSSFAHEVSEAIEPRPADLFYRTRAVEIESSHFEPAAIPLAEPLPTDSGGLRPRLSRPQIHLDRKPLPRPRKRPRDPWFLGEQWYLCVLYPLGAIPLMLRLSLLLAVLTVATVRVWPEAVDDFQGALLFLLCFPLAVVPLLPFGFAAAFLEGVFTFAAHGQVRNTSWPERNLGMALQSAVIWLICFLAGPALLAGAAVLFWLHCGDPAFVDWLILGELFFLAVGWWLFALVAVFERRRLADLQPPRVARVIARLNYRALIAAVLAAGLVYLHGRLLLFAVEETHEQLMKGFTLVTLGWFSGLYAGTFLFRLMGLWTYQARMRSAHPEPPRRGVASVET